MIFMMMMTMMMMTIMTMITEEWVEKNSDDEEIWNKFKKGYICEDDGDPE